MTWGKTSDTWHSHPKAVAAGLEAIGLWSLAQSFASDYRTDGFVPRELVIRFAGARGTKLAEKLCAARAGRPAGLWHRADDPCDHPECDRLRRHGEDGWRFHDWANYQPLRSSIEAKDAEKSEAKSRAGRLGGVRSGESRREANSKQNRSKLEADGFAEQKQIEAPIPIPIPIPENTHTPFAGARAVVPICDAGDAATIINRLAAMPAPLRYLATPEIAERFAGATISGATLDDILAAIGAASLKSGRFGSLDPSDSDQLAELADHVGGFIANHRRIARSSSHGSSSNSSSPAADRFLRHWSEAWGKAEKGTYVLADDDLRHVVALIVSAEKAASDEAVRTCVEDPDAVERNLAHWVRRFLRDPGENNYLANANHPLRFLPRRVSSYGLPPAKRAPLAKTTAIEPEGVPIPREFVAAMSKLGAGPAQETIEPIEQRQARMREQAAAMLAEEGVAE